ncbi:hypothetical protein FI667_g8909, partial [Globisporangium splendens]
MADESTPRAFEAHSHAQSSNSSSGDADDRESCPVCIAAHVVEGHSTPSAAARAANDAYHPTTPEFYTLTYKPTSQLKIFLSYGHDRFQQIAFHLKHALQQRGHVVWVDTERLSAGIDWEDGINSALTWVKEAQQDGRVVLLMTPHALRRPNGYCLNEIARAVQHHLSIFPVMVAESEPPPALTMFPYFDMRQCVPTDEDEVKLDPRSHPWLDLMKHHMHSPLFLKKSQRLFAVLELFDSMKAYGVPAVAGLENLGCFPSSFDVDSPHNLHNVRGASVRRLLARTSFGSASSLDLSSSSLPTTPQGLSPDRHNAVNTSPGTQSKELLPPGVHPETSKAQTETEETLDTTRYMFTFDGSCYLLAKKLYDDLSAVGFSMFPPSPPSDALIQIQDHDEALEWAAAERNGKTILLVTPESVGRPNGVCLRDISAAMSKGLGFVPLMVRQCEIPLSICRIQWLDMSDCLLYDASSSVVASSINEVRYDIRKDQLITALKGQLDHEGQQARLSSLLTPFPFQQQISKLASRFAGREWLFAQLTEWIDSPTASQVFWVTGQIGSGKTALAARLVQTIPEIKAFHFALQEDEQTQNARRCVLSLAYQLTTQLQEYAAFLQSCEPLEEIVPVSSFNVLMTRLLIEPLNQIARPQSQNKPLVLLIDGLEHLADGKSGASPLPVMALRPSFVRGSMTVPAAFTSAECLVSALPSLVARLPKWVRVIILSRNDPIISAKLQNFTPNIVLETYVKENKEDIKQFIEKSLCSGVSTGLSSDKMLPPDQIALIVERSEGLFLYAANIVQAIEEKRLSLDQLESLPIGMSGYLHHFFANHFDAEKYKKLIQPVLEVLCAAYEPLSLPTIASILKLETYGQQEIAAAFGSLLFIGADENVRPFHLSVLDWVQELQSVDPFYVNVANGHKRIGEWAVREYDTVVAATPREFVNLHFRSDDPSGSQSKTLSEKTKAAHAYIVRHMLSHLMQVQSEEFMGHMSKYLSDEKFQLATRLERLRSEGLESFFHGKMEREEARALLKRNPSVGNFLIRYSTTKQCYCASFIKRIDPRTNEPKIENYLFHHLPNGKYSPVPPSDVTDTTFVFPDLTSFVAYYQNKGIIKNAVAREGPLNREISSVG